MFKISIDTSTIQVNNHNVIASFWIEFDDGFAFPEKNWSDFILPVLLWWNEEALQMIIQRTNKKFNFTFMDGPFFMVLENSNQHDMVNVLFSERMLSTSKVIHEETINKKQFITELISVNTKVIDHFINMNLTLNKEYLKLLDLNERLINTVMY